MTDKQKFLHFLDSNDFESYYIPDPTSNNLDLRIKKDININGGLYVFSLVLNRYALEYASYKQNIKWLKKEFFKVFEEYWEGFIKEDYND